MKVGVLVIFSENSSIRDEIKKVHDLGMTSCQITCWNDALLTDENAKIITEASKEFGVDISTFWCGWTGPCFWNFTEGPQTLGLVPEEYREMRMAQLKKGSDFAKKLGVENIATHVGFLPENPSTPEFKSIIEALKELGTYVKENGQYFLFETGQETPVTLLRTMHDVGLDNLGINLDPANLILYGKANPVDALGVIGKYVRDVHAKDGCYPTDGRTLGRETPLGEGMVNFPALIKGLQTLGYDGAITIEREISGEQQIADIMKAKALLEACIYQ
jgi:sugar phosphate isomerase/epimerase